MLSEEDYRQIEAGQRALEHKQAEQQRAEQRQAESWRPVPVVVPSVIVAPVVPSSISNSLPKCENTNIKIWPAVGLAAIGAGHGSVYRLYELMRSADSIGQGWIRRDKLQALRDKLQISGRHWRRMVEAAIKIGVIVPDGRRYFYCSLGRAALAFGCQAVGKPVMIGVDDLAGYDWRSVVYAGYLATIEGLISQKAIEAITGVSERTQRNYLTRAPVSSIKNYCDRGQAAAGRAEGLQALGMHTFESKGRIVQRLPDSHKVPSFLAVRAAPGRSRKAQSLLNSSSFVGRGKSYGQRLFYATTKGAKAALRRLSYDEGERPLEIFEKLPGYKGRWSPAPGVGNWQAVEVCYA